MEYLGAWGTLIHEKNLKSKISCQAPFKKSFRFTKNQADLQNPCALQKIRRIYRILGLYKKSGGFTESLRFTKNRADDRILAGVKIPAPGEKTSGTGKTGGPLTV
jgi:hypothetical protein